jgi:hypothetical protein
MTPTLIVALALAADPSVESSTAWRFVLPPPGDAFEHPPLRALGLVRAKPDDLVERAAYRGARRRYAQLCYGTPGSVRVTVVLDEGTPGVADLYVDADRNRRIDDRDRVLPSGERTWKCGLPLAIVGGDTTRTEARAAVFRLGSTGLTLAFAAAGYLEGTVRLGGRDHRARRTDGDGDGRLNGPEDTLWIDRNDDGRWDPIAEQFLFGTILTIGPARFAARSDEFGGQLVLEPLQGTGTVRLAPRLAGPVSIAELSAMLIGRDGSATMLAGATAEATVPIGAYRLGTVTLALEDPGGGPRWGYVFSDLERPGEPVWYEVGKGATVAIDPLGRLELSCHVEGADPHRAGDDLRVQPRLYTRDGLLIVTCYRGTPTTPGSDDGPDAAIALVDAAGKRLMGGHSGFA